MLCPRVCREKIFGYGNPPRLPEDNFSNIFMVFLFVEITKNFITEIRTITETFGGLCDVLTIAPAPRPLRPDDLECRPPSYTFIYRERTVAIACSQSSNKILCLLSDNAISIFACSRRRAAAKTGRAHEIILGQVRFALWAGISSGESIGQALTYRYKNDPNGTVIQDRGFGSHFSHRLKAQH